jgi:hypothetical protein
MDSGSIGHSRFIALLTQRFPEIFANVGDCARRLLHPEMGTVAQATQLAINAGDHETVRKHFEFIDEVLQDAAPDVENAVYVSYLENLRFDESEAESACARKLLPPRLRQALVDLEAHWQNISRQRDT